MAFHNVRLPEQVERGATGGPGFKTTIIPLSSGFEKANQDWERARGRWTIGYGIDSKNDQEAIIAFFYARVGMANQFRFKDWTDFEIGVESTNTPQTIAVGDGVQDRFQIVRRYQSGNQIYSREITRLVIGTTRVFVAGVELFAGFSFSENSGVIDFDVAPADLQSIAIIAEFDVPVRFNTDQLDIQALTFDAMSIPSIPIIEYREELAVL